jgi:hypothetical protein
MPFYNPHKGTPNDMFDGAGVNDDEFLKEQLEQNQPANKENIPKVETKEENAEPNIEAQEEVQAVEKEPVEKEPTDTSSEADYKARYEDLLKAFHPHKTPQPIEQEPKQKQVEEPETSLYESQNFKDVMEYLNVDPKDKNVFRNFFNEFESRIKQKTIEETLKATPEVVNNLMFSQFEQKQIADNFYSTNPELNHPNLKPMVASIAERIKGENPHLPIGEVLDRTSKEAYGTLNIAKGTEKKVKKMPALSNTQKGSRPTQIKKTEQQAMIDDVLALS